MMDNDLTGTVLPVGTQGDYILLEAFKGSTATTYLAHRLPLPSWIDIARAAKSTSILGIFADSRLDLSMIAAIKTAPAHSQEASRFVQERNNLNAFARIERETGSHFFPRVVGYYESVPVGSERYVVLAQEFAPGRNLSELLRSYRAAGTPAVPEQVALSIAEKYIAMLEVAHRAEIMSFDRKLGDVFWEKTPGASPISGKLTVIDWNVTEVPSVSVDILRFGMLWLQLLAEQDPGSSQEFKDVSHSDLRATRGWQRISFGSQRLLRVSLHPDPKERFDKLADVSSAIQSLLELWAMPLGGDDGLIGRATRLETAAAGKALDRLDLISVAAAKCRQSEPNQLPRVESLWKVAQRAASEEIAVALRKAEQDFRHRQYGAAKTNLRQARMLAGDEIGNRLRVERRCYLIDAAMTYPDQEAIHRLRDKLVDSVAALDDSNLDQAESKFKDLSIASQTVATAMNGFAGEATIRTSYERGRRLTSEGLFDEAVQQFAEAVSAKWWDALPGAPMYQYRSLVRESLPLDPEKAWKEAIQKRDQIGGPQRALNRGAEFESARQFASAEEVYRNALSAFPERADLRESNQRAASARQIDELRRVAGPDESVVRIARDIQQKFPGSEASRFAQEVEVDIGNRHVEVITFADSTVEFDTDQKALSFLAIHFANDDRISARISDKFRELDDQMQEALRLARSNIHADRAPDFTVACQQIERVSRLADQKTALSRAARREWSDSDVRAKVSRLSVALQSYRTGVQAIQQAVREPYPERTLDLLKPAETAFSSLAGSLDTPEPLAERARNWLALVKRFRSQTAFISERLTKAEALVSEGENENDDRRQIDSVAEAQSCLAEAQHCWENLRDGVEIEHALVAALQTQITQSWLRKFRSLEDKCNGLLANDKRYLESIPLLELMNQVLDRQRALNSAGIENEVRTIQDLGSRLDQRRRDTESMRVITNCERLVGEWTRESEVAAQNQNWELVLESAWLAEGRLEELQRLRNQAQRLNGSERLEEQRTEIERLKKHAHDAMARRSRQSPVVAPAPLSGTVSSQSGVANVDFQREDARSDQRMRMKIEALQVSVSAPGTLPDFASKLKDLDNERGMTVQNLRDINLLERQYIERSHFLQLRDAVIEKWDQIRVSGDSQFSGETWWLALGLAQRLLEYAPEDLPPIYWHAMFEPIVRRYRQITDGAPSLWLRQNTDIFVYLGMLYFRIKRRAFNQADE